MAAEAASEPRSATIPINQNADRTPAEFVPAFFDVHGDGSCFLYSILHGVGTKEYAQSMRHMAVDIISAKANKYMSDYESIKSQLAIFDEEFHVDLHGAMAEIGTHMMQLFGIESVGDISQTVEKTKRKKGEKDIYLYICSNKVAKKLKSMRNYRTYVDEPMMQVISQFHTHHITVISIPQGWYFGRYDVTEESSISGNSIRDLNDMGEFRDETIFVIYTGGHYMRVIFLNTHSYSLQYPMVIDTVPTWERHLWANRIVQYWGFVPQRFMTWQNICKCGYRGCDKKLGHPGGH